MSGSIKQIHTTGDIPKTLTASQFIFSQSVDNYWKRKLSKQKKCRGPLPSKQVKSKQS